MAAGMKVRPSLPSQCATSCVAAFGSRVHRRSGSTNRQNANRLFNTQNNAAGGYGVNTYDEPMAFFAGSELLLQWTTRDNGECEFAHCDYIVQYMCGSSDAAASDLIRDG